MTAVPKEFIYDGSSEELRQVYELYRKGTTVLCPKCQAQLIVALDLETANKHEVHPGLYCPVDPRHLAELLSLADVHHKVLDIFFKPGAGREKV